MENKNNYKQINYVILGAGPAGLSFANRLAQLGEDSFIVLEKESEAGGLCRSEIVDGSPLDIGGGHFLDVKRNSVLDFIFKFLPKEEWNEFNRVSKIKFHNMEIDYPFESNLWQLPEEFQKEFLESISKAGCNTNKPIPQKFKEWISWKLGDKIAEEYMFPYNKKIWSINLDRLGTYWLYKLPSVSYEETLLSCRQKRAVGKIPAHDRFIYPKKGGYGIIWKLMSNKIKDKILFNEPLRKIDINNLVVNNKFQAKTIITTIPWTEFLDTTNLSEDIKELINKLEYTSIKITYYQKSLLTDAYWTYIPEENISYHRIVHRNNFCPGSKGHWTETNTKRAEETSNWSHINKYAYPLNTIEKPQTIKSVLEWGANKKIYGLGRWGEWEHMNSDVAVEHGINLADNLFNKNNLQ